MPRDPLSRVRPGYHGKLPARADFVGAGFARGVASCWDSWLQQALCESQAALGADWLPHYRTAPLWRFLLQPGICGPTALAGVLMPSMDAVGRCFPLMLGQPVPGPVDLLALLGGSARWFAAAEARLLAALDPATDPQALAAPLPPLPPPCPAGDTALPGLSGQAGCWLPLPGLAAAAPALATAPRDGRERPRGLWCTTGGPRVPPGIALTPGLIAPAAFAALLDGNWARHGWTTPAAEHDGPAWDRET